MLLVDTEICKFVSFLFSNDDIQNCVIYLCATMWHETYDEMLKILTSMFRLVAGLVGSLNWVMRPFLIFEFDLKVLKRCIACFETVSATVPTSLKLFGGEKKKQKKVLCVLLPPG